MLKIKSKVNYRRGGTSRSCGDCDHFRSEHQIYTCNGIELRKEPRCTVIGLENGRMYRVHQRNVCDRYDNTLTLKRIKGEA